MGSYHSTIPTFHSLVLCDLQWQSSSLSYLESRGFAPFQVENGENPADVSPLCADHKPRPTFKLSQKAVSKD